MAEQHAHKARAEAAKMEARTNAIDMFLRNKEALSAKQEAQLQKLLDQQLAATLAQLEPEPAEEEEEWSI